MKNASTSDCDQSLEQRNNTARKIARRRLPAARRCQHKAALFFGASFCVCHLQYRTQPRKPLWPVFLSPATLDTPLDPERTMASRKGSNLSDTIWHLRSVQFSLLTQFGFTMDSSRHLDSNPKHCVYTIMTLRESPTSVQSMSRQSQCSRIIQAPSRTVGFTRRFHTLSSIQATNTSLAVVPQSPVVVHTFFARAHSARRPPSKTAGCWVAAIYIGLRPPPRIFLNSLNFIASQSHQNILASSPNVSGTLAGERSSKVSPLSAFTGFPEGEEQEAASASFQVEGRARWVSDYGEGQLSQRQLQHFQYLRTTLQKLEKHSSEKKSIIAEEMRFLSTLLMEGGGGCGWHSGRTLAFPHFDPSWFPCEVFPFPPPLHFNAAPYLPYFTLIGSQYLGCYKPPNLPTDDGGHGGVAAGGATVAEGVSLPPSHQGDPGSIPGRVTSDFRMWESCRTMTLVSRFPQPPPPLPNSGAAPYSPQSPLSALKTSMLRCSRVARAVSSHQSDLGSLLARYLLNFFKRDHHFHPPLHSGVASYSLSFLLSSEDVRCKELPKPLQQIDVVCSECKDDRHVGVSHVRLVWLRSLRHRLYLVSSNIFGLTFGASAVKCKDDRHVGVSHVRLVWLRSLRHRLYLVSSNIFGLTFGASAVKCKDDRHVGVSHVRLVWLRSLRHRLYLVSSNIFGLTFGASAVRAAVAESLACRLPPRRTGLNPPRSLRDFRMWESCRTMPLVGGSSRGYHVFSALSFRRCSILTSLTLINSQDLAVKSRPNLFTHSLNEIMHCIILGYPFRSTNSLLRSFTWGYINISEKNVLRDGDAWSCRRTGFRTKTASGVGVGGIVYVLNLGAHPSGQGVEGRGCLQPSRGDVKLSCKVVANLPQWQKIDNWGRWVNDPRTSCSGKGWRWKAGMWVQGPRELSAPLYPFVAILPQCRKIDNRGQRGSSPRVVDAEFKDAAYLVVETHCRMVAVESVTAQRYTQHNGNNSTPFQRLALRSEEASAARVIVVLIGPTLPFLKRAKNIQIGDALKDINTGVTVSPEVQDLAFTEPLGLDH
ncbi:hypothetical protein PR048_003487 [Dryococelus australis]|uniref:PDZ domain-containing protein n=1 Tax=Dryococelus australis TaxID=614101 RepID=A0ABQ9INA2_9NEOP|nr:hypothetical protein PR048_003487 [Dryococelus australis]